MLLVLLACGILATVFAGIAAFRKIDGKASHDCETIEVDVVVVGMGSAGSSAADQFVRAGLQVAILEQGLYNEDNPLVNVPSNNGILVTRYTNTLFSQLGHSEFEGGIRFPIVQGKSCGGGGDVNGMQWVRGTADDFTEWEDWIGDSRWGPAAFESEFIDIETFNGVHVSDMSVHGTSGPVSILQTSTNPMQAMAFVTAANNLYGADAPIIDDYNKYNLGGDPYWQVSQTVARKRASPCQSLINPYVECKDNGGCANPKLLFKTYALRLIYHPDNNTRVIGVEALRDGRCLKVMARKQVVITMGIQTPFLLLRSGIGNKTQSDIYGIENVLDNPHVGKHVTNHLILALTGTGTVNSTVVDPQGLYTGAVFLKDASQSSSRRAFELIGIASPGAFTIAGLLLLAKSEGEFYLEQSDPLAMPAVRLHYFANPDDVDSMVQMAKNTNEILVEMGLTPLVTFANDAAIIDYILGTSSSAPKYSQAYHWLGAARMAPTIDDGVVDETCAVHGITGLSIADNSVMPVQNSGNTDAVARVIGRMCAKRIIERL